MTYQAIPGNKTQPPLNMLKFLKNGNHTNANHLNESNHHLNELIHSGSPEIGQKVIRDSNHDSDSSKH